MIKQVLSYSLFGCLALFSLSSFGQETDYQKLLTQLKQLVTEKEYKKAYEQSNEQLQYLGEVEFDYLLGISALKTNQNDSAVFAFERVIETNPYWHDARLYLVSAYLMVDNFSAAKTHALMLTNSSATPVNIKASAQSLLDIIAYKKRLAGRTYDQNIVWGIGVDNNVNAGTEQDTIIIPNFGEILLSSDSQSTKDNYTQLKYRGVYTHPLNQKNSVILSINAGLYKFQELDQYDRSNAQINANYKHQEDNITWHVGGALAPLILDGDLYRTETSLTTGADVKLSKKNKIFGSVTYGKTNNKFVEELNNSFFTFNVGTNYVSENWYQSLSLNYKDEDSEITSGEFNARTVLGLYYQANTQLTKNINLSAVAGHQWIKHQAEHPLFLQDRKDNLLMLSSTLGYSVNRNFAIQLSANYQEKTSNIMLFEYDRSDINLNFTYSF